jgi:hypothetical protein
MRCSVGKIFAYNSPNCPPTAHVATLPLHYRYRYAATLLCALNSWLLEWSAAISIILDIVKTKNTSHIERKTRLSSLNPKGYFILRNKQLDSSCSSGAGDIQKQSRQSARARRDQLPSLKGIVASSRRSPVLVIHNFTRLGPHADSLENCWDCNSPQAREGRLHSSKGFSADLTTFDGKQRPRGSSRSASLVHSRRAQALTSKPLRGKT